MVATVVSRCHPLGLGGKGPCGAPCALHDVIMFQNMAIKFEPSFNCYAEWKVNRPYSRQAEKERGLALAVLAGTVSTTRVLWNFAAFLCSASQTAARSCLNIKTAADMLRAGMTASRLEHRGHVIPALTDHMELLGGVIGAANIAETGLLDEQIRLIRDVFGPPYPLSPVVALCLDGSIAILMMACCHIDSFMVPRRVGTRGSRGLHGCCGPQIRSAVRLEGRIALRATADRRFTARRRTVLRNCK
jgi:hypothetical protein